MAKKGQALIEFVGVLIFFLAFITFFVDLGRVFLSMQSMYSAAYEGVRKGALTRAQSTLQVAEDTAMQVIETTMPYYKSGHTSCSAKAKAPQGIIVNHPLTVKVECAFRPIFADTVLPNTIKNYINFPLSRSYTGQIEDP